MMPMVVYRIFAGIVFFSGLLLVLALAAAANMFVINPTYQGIVAGALALLITVIVWLAVDIWCSGDRL